MSNSARHRDAMTVVPYPLRVTAAVSWRLLVVAGLLVVIGHVVIWLRVVVVPVAVALLLAALLGPVVNWMTRHRVPRGIATTVVLISGLALLGGLLTFVVQAFVSGLPDLRVQVGDSIQEIRRVLNNPPFGLPPVNLDSVLNSVGDWLTGNSDTITSGAVSTAVGVGEFLVGAGLALFTLIYFLYGGRSMWQYLLGVVPSPVRDRADIAGQRAFASLVGFVRATLLVAVVDAAGVGIGLLAVGAPLVVPLSALVFLGAFVPVIGAVISGVVAVLVVLVAKGLVTALVMLGVVIGVQQLEGNVLQPLLLGRAVKLSGVAVVLAVAVGSVVAGITGALLAVPMLAMLNAGIRSLVTGDDGKDEPFSRRPVLPRGSALPVADVPVGPDPAPDPDPLIRTDERPTGDESGGDGAGGVR